MASVNKVMIGNLGRAPEMRYLPSGDAIAHIAVATSYKSKARNTGEQKELTEWHRISFFCRLAEIVSQYLKKGASVYVESRLQTRKHTDKDGVEKYATEIIADNMQMLGSRFTRHNRPLQVFVEEFQSMAGTGFYLGDQLLCTRNLWDWGLQNGSLGRLVEIEDTPPAADQCRWRGNWPCHCVGAMGRRRATPHS